MNTKRKALSILEILIAVGMAGIVITTAFGTIGNVFFTQKKVRVSQDFHGEARFLMERVVQIARNNTIDYDRFYETFSENCGGIYPEQFFEDVGGGELRNLGGLTATGDVDPCTRAWDEDTDTTPLTTLYLINGSRTLRTALRKNNDTIEIQTQLAVDTDEDGKADFWSESPLWNDGGSGICEINTGTKYPVLGDFESLDFCQKAHDWVRISPHKITIDEIHFEPSPNRDPFLAFAIDSAQIHPHVFIVMKASLSNPEEFGLEADEIPNIILQTSASSRVFGDTRQ
ncbi:hypothetical protein K9M59_01260 [Candidatus Gracilibacteria bacterium]|nr:hypothetical protein [Candidatus Gracilibacteria bacterium]MCF7819196.1 hypothetical protein [Candidatus Gracilibacteria bacterium]